MRESGTGRGLFFQRNRPVCVVEEMPPGSVFFRTQGEPQDRAAARLDGLANQVHAGLEGQAAALARVAARAGADDVLPRGPAAARTGQHVVEAQFAGGEVSATVLAAIVVAQKNVAAIQPHALLGDPVVEQEREFQQMAEHALSNIHDQSM